MKLAIQIFFGIQLLGSSFFPTWAKIYIDINQVSSNSFPIAMVLPVQDGGEKDPDQLNRKFFTRVSQDLELMGIFRVIQETSFLKNDPPKELSPSRIDFSGWALLDALALVKGWYRRDKNRITLEVHLYDVLAKKELLAKQYQASIEQIPWMAHHFADEIIRILTGEEGVFNSQLAFVGTQKSKKELYLMNFDGSGFRQLTHHGSMVFSPMWNTEGNKIFYTAFGKSQRQPLFQYDLSTQAIREISKFPGMTIGLGINPSSSEFVTTLTKDGNSELYLLSPSGAIRERITVNDDIDVSARFSPDGKDIVFVSNRHGSAQIYRMNLSSKAVQRLTFKGLNNASPTWSPRGDKILFAGMDTDGHFDIFSMNSDGSGDPVRLTYDSRNNEDPCWSPNGHLISFSSNRTGKYQIWSMRPDGTKQTQLTHQSLEFRMPSWGPRKK